mmetsp:Transcript_13280/g.19860  ORF Transcript_13280/g.19860 Transcript_13280/m.19860 type:complete len:306 (+) Transcript_13280:1003-1920(+)
MPREPNTMRSKGFCFIEYSSADSAKAALSSMNGYEFNGRKLKVGRPSSNTSAGGSSAGLYGISSLAAVQQGHLSGGNPHLAFFQAQQMGAMQLPQSHQASVGSKTRIYVGSVYFNVNQDQIYKVFEPFGKIRSCQLIPNPQTGLHKGYGFIDFEDEQSATEAIENMDGFELCGRPLKVGWATNAATHQPPVTSMHANQEYKSAILATLGGMQPDVPVSRCLRLSNMVNVSDIGDEELILEVKEECEKISPVENVIIRCEGNSAHFYVLFKDKEGGVKGMAKLNGRWFGGREIQASYCDSVIFSQK